MNADNLANEHDDMPHHLHGTTVANDISRRGLALGVAGLGTAAVVDRVAGGALLSSLSGSSHGAPAGVAVDAATLQQEHANANHKPTMTDYLGTALFAKGVKDLAGGGYVTSGLYTTQAALLAAKYAESDATGKHHIVEEIGVTFNAFGIIAGTVALASGLRLDIEKSFESLAGRAASRSDKVALLTMFSAVSSPALTTVGNAQITGRLAQEVADGDTGIMSVLVGHNAGRSGYLFFGDPPFIALVEKYGFAEAVKWQAQHMWPLALYSLVSSTFKVNYQLARKDGLSHSEAFAAASRDTSAGMARNLPVLVGILKKSLKNAAKYGLAQGHEQDIGGLQVMVGEVLQRYARNALDFVMAHPKFDESNPETEAGETGDPVQAKHDELVGEFMDQFGGTFGFDASPAAPKTHTEAVVEEPVETSDANIDEVASMADELAARMKHAADRGDWDSVLQQARQFLDDTQFANFEGMLGAYRRMSDNIVGKESGAPSAAAQAQATRRGLFAMLGRTKHHADKTFDLHRFKNAFGHEIGDVLNVFLFQALSVIFLVPVFRAALESAEEGLRGLGLSEEQMEHARETLLFFSLLGFSMVADNYVACKIGLELLPEKPQVALIAAIEGGELSGIGNMANLVLAGGAANFPLMDSIAQNLKWNLDSVALAYIYSLGMGSVQKIFGTSNPKPLH